MNTYAAYDLLSFSRFDQRSKGKLSSKFSLIAMFLLIVDLIWSEAHLRR